MFVQQRRMRVDTERRRETPEGVNLSLRVAGPAPRFLAWAVDTIIILVILATSAIVIGVLGGVGQGLQFLLMFCLWWFYPVAFELFRDGSTPGKSAFGLQVIHDDGTPIGPTASLLRNFLLFADFLPFAYGAALASMLASRDFQRLGDLAAGTLVIYRDDASALDPRIPEARPLSPAVALDRREQRAVIDFATRLPSWTDERQAELADVAAGLTGARGARGVARLTGIANWLAGRRPGGREGSR